MKIALFPGSFDPVTKAHVDILRRSISLFDKVIVGIGLNSTKQPFLDSKVRKKILEAVFKDEEKIKVTTYEGLTVDYAKKIGASYIIRGIRSVSDFEYEKTIAHVNHALVPEIESIFILSKPGYSSISSTIVRDILRNKGDISLFVPEEVMQFL
ncbi:MAG TPA: pantetheine-phosphate adenylyltransferase [Sphingobacteriaceae bacterium]|nr:pantetheine-phosphate adenylyltransferase [Sphingobacteriaceae bacterium]